MSSLKLSKIVALKSVEHKITHIRSVVISTPDLACSCTLDDHCFHFTTFFFLEARRMGLLNESENLSTPPGSNPQSCAYDAGTLPPSHRMNINAALFSYTWSFDDGHCNFEPWSSDEDDT
ncbi:hypothetical protein TNCV_2909171 [Trichonephila clavipes]|nr:hypothetical protein TNCV_2909171 [Trichonephila clavipes]